MKRFLRRARGAEYAKQLHTTLDRLGKSTGHGRILIRRLPTPPISPPQLRTRRGKTRRKPKESQAILSTSVTPTKERARCSSSLKGKSEKKNND